jgi:hypothetical protein
LTYALVVRRGFSDAIEGGSSDDQADEDDEPDDDDGAAGALKPT